MKPCIKCGSFERKKNNDCLPCSKERDRLLYEKNKEQRKQKAREYYAANKEKQRKANAAWKARNYEKKRALDKAYREAHPERMAAYKKKYYALNTETVKQRAKDYVENNREYVRERNRIYFKDRPEVRVNAKAKRRSRIGNDKLPRGTIPKQYAKQNGLCACCGKPLGDKYHVDHIMPLALGGRNIPENIQLLLGPCNQRKSKKHPDAWMAEIQNPQTSSRTSYSPAPSSGFM
jgi:5-methylcytosine-specific restriction endonuclease McrA